MSAETTAVAGPPRVSSSALERAQTFVLQVRGEFVVLAVAVLAHGWLLFNDGIYWDDWLLYTHLKHGDWAVVQAMASQTGGVPLYLYLWAALAALPGGVLGFKVVSFLLIVASGLLIYRICLESTFLSRTESIFIAAIAVAYPADHTHVLMITIPYLLWWVMFLLGVLLLMRSQVATGRPAIVLHLTALVAFLLSFALNSLLVYYFGALLFGVLYLSRKRGVGLWPLLRRELPRNIDLVLAPFAYWVLARALFPANGIYDYYHQFASAASWPSSFRGFWQQSVTFQIQNSLDQLVQFSWLWLVALIGVQLLRSRSQPAGPSIRQQLVTIGFGVLLAFMAVSPYVLVGLYPSAEGWSSRHALLLALPVAIVLVAAVRLVFSQPRGGLSALGTAVIVSLLLGFILASAETYLGWEARWVKDQSVMANLAADPNAKQYSVYWVTDRDVHGGEPNYRFYEWGAILNQTYGGQSRIGLDTTATPAGFLVQRASLFPDPYYGVQNFDPAGCEAALSITAGPEARSELGLIWRYWYYTLFDPSGRDRWLAGVTTVTVRPYAAAQATNCAIS